LLNFTYVTVARKVYYIILVTRSLTGRQKEPGHTLWKFYSDLSDKSALSQLHRYLETNFGCYSSVLKQNIRACSREQNHRPITNCFNVIHLKQNVSSIKTYRFSHTPAGYLSEEAQKHWIRKRKHAWGVLWEVLQHTEKWRFHPFDFGVIRYFIRFFRPSPRKWKQTLANDKLQFPSLQHEQLYETLHLGEGASGSSTDQMWLNSALW